METDCVPTWEGKIYLGLRDGYTDKYHTKEQVVTFLNKYCTGKRLCVTVTDTLFVYVDGEEPGVIIGMIDYPRFPNTNLALESKALELGELLMKEFDQYRVSIVFPEKTLMLSNEEKS